MEQKSFRHHLSLDDIVAHRDILQDKLDKDNQRISMLWGNLTRKSGSQTPVNRLARVVNTGGNVLEGALLGWKLYRMLSGKGLFKKKKR